uniref:Pectinesterase inhibitor domain-containing protein n=1 Tax=Zea mays TaxID=4577 RepID=A0A804PSW8_MAIZE
MGSSSVTVTTPTTLCAAALLLLVLGTAVAPCSAQAVVTIEEACRMAASGSGGVAYDHCVASLASDARSRDAADLHRLAALAARIAVEHAAATEAKIEGLGEASQQLSAALGAAESCEDVWKGEEHVPVATHDREYGRMALVTLGLTSGIA